MSAVKRAEVVIERGEGAYLWDESGRRLLDAPAGLWYCNVGHGRTEIADAVARQMARIETYHTFNQYANRPAIELAARVAELSGLPEPKVFLTSGGSDAIDTAGKLARRYWSALGKPDKQTIVTRDRGYHGLHTLGTSIVGLEIQKEGMGPLVRETVRVPTNDAAAFERTVQDLGADSIAAFFAEPIVGTGGVVHPADGYFEAVQRICRDNDILFVADEVVCGFGRTGEWFGTHRFGLEPDMMVFAKGVTSGYLPLGGVVAAERVAAPFWEDGSELIFRHGLTYAGHATVCAAALANLDILEREQLAGASPRARGRARRRAATARGEPARARGTHRHRPPHRHPRRGSPDRASRLGALPRQGRAHAGAPRRRAARLSALRRHRGRHPSPRRSAQRGARRGSRRGSRGLTARPDEIRPLHALAVD